ncbi:TIGR04282 family arsenosugar biosynthesis glycosyltransferase [Mangrovivirga sp. M17]|uniref:TIGR04282 family arsenosugar biosynthesis glycosyltransferase n=1 Tax=Mangrovivirga halotolerans TaxID=2993936 RepID=A0ABT3RTK9_9BACT|nr:TIGR04282 family arsenosugar biosynthesis glycosyltransferase [Mangrovivirga halotolerans]MCX2745118.1 TIGR04282 family arsenosugar biosynthesis glycosyltransferase [Mangrovivirga halotolerans]
MTEAKLIVFVKQPEIGKVKTRLAKDIGEEKALQIYKKLLKKTAELIEESHWPTFVYYKDQIGKNDHFSIPWVIKKTQSEGDLGKKMHDAFVEVKEETEADKIIIIGSDCYDLSLEHLEIAAQKLDNNDVVIGPSNDGGYYLLGLKSIYKKLFSGIKWSTPEVLDKTIEKCNSLGLKIDFIEQLIDIDTLDDLNSINHSSL